MINRLIRGAIQTGLFASIFALADLFSFVLHRETNLYAMFAFPIGRIYTNVRDISISLCYVFEEAANPILDLVRYSKCSYQPKEWEYDIWRRFWGTMPRLWSLTSLITVMLAHQRVPNAEPKSKSCNSDSHDTLHSCQEGNRHGHIAAPWTFHRCEICRRWFRCLCPPIRASLSLK